MKKKVKTSSKIEKKKKATKSLHVLPTRSYERLLKDVVDLLEGARHSSARAVNSIMTATYWEVGQRIILLEQRGAKSKAEYYGEQIVEKLSADLTSKFGRGFGRSNLFQMRAFYLAFPEKKVQTLSGQSSAPQFPLPWSHYVKLLSLEDTKARKFYHSEALRGGWSVRQLERQISSLFYERTLASKNKIAMLTKASKARQGETSTPEEEIKDPFVLEFLGLKDEYSENDLEEALVRHLEAFLLELGGDFTFIGRQRRLRVGDEWYRVDLVFFHRRLKCLILIDLKLGKFSHADAGQMHLYLNYARDHWTHEDENPPVGLILCAAKDAMVAKYALEGLPNKVIAARYRTALPQEKKLVAELKKTQKRLKQAEVRKKKPE
jgi:predicted nuclease of restriction endonuclease-like (RecB) superfamily